MTNHTTPQADSAPLTLVDIGINLTHDSYDTDRDAVIARARHVGVAQMIVTGATLEGSRKAIELARSRPGELYATAGVHPHHATELNRDALGMLEELARQPEVVAAGECGLDYFRDFSPRPVQQEAFHHQLELAARVGKPVFLHQRDAHEDFLAILKEHLPTLHGGVTHCFTGGPRELAAYLDLGFSIGVTGWICDERRGAHLLPLMREIPADRLLLETDGPYLLPRDLHPKPASRRNEPVYLPHIAAVVARARNESLAALAASSTAATRALFSITSI